MYVSTFILLSSLNYLLVSKRRGKEKDDGTKADKSKDGEEGSSKVSRAGGNHLGRLCDTASGNIGNRVKG